MLTCSTGAVFLSKISGGKISEDEAHTVLVGQGDIEAVWHATPTDREINRLPEGQRAHSISFHLAHNYL